MLFKLSMFIIKTRFKKNFKNIYLKLLVVYSLCNYYYMMLINVFYIIENYIHHVHNIIFLLFFCQWWAIKIGSTII